VEKRLPLDSMAVVARPAGGLRTAVLADILADDLAAALGRSRRLRVPGAEFVRPYAKSEMSAEEIGRALNVRGVALCTVAAAGACVDVVVEVIDVLREQLVARGKFLLSSREIPALERAILRTIAGHDRVVPRSAPVAEILEARLARAAGDPEMALEILGDAAPLETAATIVEGRLCARIAEARRLLKTIRGSVRALQLQARLLARFDGDWAGAEASLRQALRIDPASPSTHAMLGDLLLATGRRDAAAPHHRLVAELMPVEPRAQIAGAFADYFGPFPIDAVARLAELPDGVDVLYGVRRPCRRYLSAGTAGALHKMTT
jgi:TolB-like protein